MVLTPDRFSEVSTYDLLQAAADGKIGFDHRLLRVILDRGEEAVPDLVRWGTEEHPDELYDLSDELVSIFRHLKTPRSIPFFVSYLRREPNSANDDIPDALYPVRHEALEPLLQLYGELEEEDSGEVAFLLAAFRIHDDRVLRILTDRIEFDAVDSAIALGLYGDARARPALEALRASAKEDEQYLVRNVDDALSELGRPVEDEEGLIEYNIFEDFSEEASPSFEDLEESDRVEYLDASDADYRLGAASSFVNQELSSPVVKILLERAKTDEDPRVRAKCWEALSDQVDEKPIREAMLAAIRDESASDVERAGALVGLASESAEPSLRAYAEKFYAEPATRAAALKAMWGSMDKTFSDYFPRHLQDPDMEIKKQAIAGVGYLGIASSAEALRQFFDHEDLRPNALFAYALSARQEISRGRIRAFYRRIEELAGALEPEEQALVEMALDERLLLHGHKPVFTPERFSDLDLDEPAPAEEAKAPSGKVGRNDPCPCGSGKKHKRCCGAE